MSENKRFYWLKLQEDFFEDDTIDFIESQENGEKYCLFYLKLCLKALKSEKFSHERDLEVPAWTGQRCLPSLSPVCPLPSSEQRSSPHDPRSA